jgi:hypothetical protein
MTESARDRAIRRNADAARRGTASTAYDPEAASVPRIGEAVRNRALNRGDIIASGRKARAVVARVEWRGESWAVTLLRFAAPGLLSRSDPVTSFVPPALALAPKVYGRWEGEIQPGAAGKVVPLNPSADSSTVVPSQESQPKEADMAKTVVKNTAKGTRAKAVASPKTPEGKSASGEAVKQASAAKTNGGAAKTSPSKFSLNKADATRLAKRIKAEGLTLRQLKAEFGISTDVPIREALRLAGFTTKGEPNPEHLTPTELRERARAAEGAKPAKAKKASTAKQAKAPKADASAEPEAVDAAEGEARKGTGKRVARRAVKANPSN